MNTPRTSAALALCLSGLVSAQVIGVPNSTLVATDLTPFWATTGGVEHVTGQVFTEHVVVEAPTLYLGCIFEAGVTFKDSSYPSSIYRSAIGNSIAGESHATVSCEPNSKPRIEQCRFTGCAGAGVLVTGGLVLYRCDFTQGEWADNVIGGDGWGGGTIDQCLFVEKGVTFNGSPMPNGCKVGNKMINLRHAANGDKPGAVVVRNCTVVARRAIDVGTSGAHVELHGVDVYAPPSGPGVEFFAYLGSREISEPPESMLPADFTGVRFQGDVLLRTFPYPPAVISGFTQASNKYSFEDINGIHSHEDYGCGGGWSGFLDGAMQ